MARRSAASDDSFWASYADLATGTMVIFLLLMVALAAAMRKQKDAQAQQVSELAKQVQVILGTRQKLAEALKVAVSDKARVDPVTAQMVVDEQEGKISFARNKAELTPNAQDYIEGLVPGYVCALWTQDCQQRGFQNPTACPRMDPEHPNGVRRILVTGHADLVGNADGNRNLSAQRADAVVQLALGLLRDPPPDSLEGGCLEHSDKLLQYAEERFMALGAGDVEHCRKELRADSQAESLDPCSRLSTEEPSQRRVTFELELTGADMTGLVFNLLDLQRATNSLEARSDAGSSAVTELEGLRDTIAAGCWEDPGRYHDCDSFVTRCDAEPSDGEQRTWCDGFDDQSKKVGSPLHAYLCRRHNREENRSGCGVTP